MRVPRENKPSLGDQSTSQSLSVYLSNLPIYLWYILPRIPSPRTAGILAIHTTLKIVN